MAYNFAPCAGEGCPRESACPEVMGVLLDYEYGFHLKTWFLLKTSRERIRRRRGGGQRGVTDGCLPLPERDNGQVMAWTVVLAR